MVDWIRFDVLAWNQRKTDALREGCQEQVAFHQRKVHTDTDAWTSSKWHKRIAWKLFFAFRSETFRIKRFWIGKVLGTAMQRIGCKQNDLVFADMIPIDLHIA